MSFPRRMVAYRAWRWPLILIFSLLFVSYQTPPIAQATSPRLALRSQGVWAAPQASGESGAPLCRFGLNVSSFTSHPFYIDDFDIAPLRVGWYIDYRAAPSPPANNGAEYAMVVSVSDDEEGNYSYSPRGSNLDATIAAHPGGIYIVGNEPDRRVLQHDVLPENYAIIYHEAYEEIKSKDPNAQVWAGAIVQPTPLRLEYLDKVLAAYQARYMRPMPVDGWAVHAFLLNERSCSAYNNDLNVCWGADIPPGSDATDGEIRTPQDNARFDLFQAGVLRFRTWMAANGYRDTPLFVTEYGVLMPPGFGFPPSIVNQYMNETFDFMLNTKDISLGLPADDHRLVQRFAWFSTFDPNFNGQIYRSADQENPMQPPFVLSEMGAHFRDYAAQEAESSDLALLSVHLDESGGQVVATVGNSGNRLAPTQARLRFFTGETLATATQIGDDVTVAVAGCGTTQRYAVSWNSDDDVPRFERVWAQIDQADFGEESDENNLLSNDFLVNGRPTYLPTIRLFAR